MSGTWPGEWQDFGWALKFATARIMMPYYYPYGTATTAAGSNWQTGTLSRDGGTGCCAPPAAQPAGVCRYQKNNLNAPTVYQYRFHYPRFHNLLAFCKFFLNHFLVHLPACLLALSGVRSSSNLKNTLFSLEVWPLCPRRDLNPR